jgi:shikimate kinase
MGSGKTTVGALAARELGWRFHDMDSLLEARTGLSVPEAFRTRGEPWFREQELALARELSALADVVIASGGGAFAVEETRALLSQGAVTVWLRCDLDTVLGRIALDGTRPLARDRATMRKLFAQRDPLYRLADCHVDASQDPPETVASAVVAALR